MKIGMKMLKIILVIVLALWSVLMLLDGGRQVIATTGMVQGSEFGMLISISNQLGEVMIWLALFAIWRVVPVQASEPKDKGS